MKSLICIFAVIIGVMFTSCDKEDLIISETRTMEDILTFNSLEEFNNCLVKVNAMSESERLVWEKEQGFMSYGTISSKKYYSIDFSKYKSVEEIKNDVYIRKYVKVFS